MSGRRWYHLNGSLNFNIRKVFLGVLHRCLYLRSVISSDLPDETTIQEKETIDALSDLIIQFIDQDGQSLTLTGHRLFFQRDLADTPEADCFFKFLDARLEACFQPFKRQLWLGGSTKPPLYVTLQTAVLEAILVSLHALCCIYDIDRFEFRVDFFDVLDHLVEAYYDIGIGPNYILQPFPEGAEVRMTTRLELVCSSPIDKLTFKKLNSKQKSEFPNCPICFESFKSEEELTLLNCGHFYHVKCLKEWLKGRSTCPYCRNNQIFNEKPKCQDPV